MQQLDSIKTKVRGTLQSNPFIAIALAIGTFVLLIIIGGYFRQVRVDETKVAPLIKKVATFTIGESPRIKMFGEVEKTGVVTITSLTGGVVSKIHVTEGQRIKKGTTLISLSSNYAGASASLVQRQLAQKQKLLSEKTLEIQRDIIAKQRDLADKSRDNAEELRKISDKSIEDTQATITQNGDLIKAIDSQIAYLEGINVGGSQTASILSLKGQKSQLSSGNLQLKSSLENLRYSTDTSKPPTALAQISKDLIQRQLDLQLKSLEIGQEISTLQLSLAYIQESLMYPSAPFTAIVQKVWPKVGEAISPGMPLAVLAQVYEEDPATVVVYVDERTAESIGRGEPAHMMIADQVVKVIPSYISIEPVRGQLFAVYLPVPDDLVPLAKNGSHIAVELPIGHAQTGTTMPYIPIEVVSQTQTGAYVYTINKQSSAEAKLVELGPVIGSMVQVSKGLKMGDKVITNTNVLTGDMVAE